MSYKDPGAPVSASWQSHKDRTPPSSEPGTDYGMPYGAKVYAPGVGTVIEVKTSNSGAMGRYVAVRLDDGRDERQIHLSEVRVGVGARVSSSVVVGLSGASGNGSDYYYGPHMHQTLWPGRQWQAATIDYERYVGAPPAPAPDISEGDEDMFRACSASSGNWYVIGEFSVTTIPAAPSGSGNWENAVAYNDMTGRSFPTVSSDRIKRALADVDERIRDFYGRINPDAAAAASARIERMIETEDAASHG